MRLKSAFSSQQQFHLLINMQGKDHHMAVLPGNDRRRFLIIDQGNILGELGFDEQFDCIFNQTDLSTHVMEQLHMGIKNHY